MGQYAALSSALAAVGCARVACFTAWEGVGIAKQEPEHLVKHSSVAGFRVLDRDEACAALLAPGQGHLFYGALPAVKRTLPGDSRSQYRYSDRYYESRQTRLKGTREQLFPAHQT